MKVAIIGAGASGLAAIRICLEYGFEPTCLEQTTDIGGLWRYKPEQCEGLGSVMKSTILNTSKEMTAFSDFPMGKDLPNFMHNRLYMEYLRQYAENFNLLDYIHFETEVKQVQRHHDFEKSGKWEVVYQKRGGSEITGVFDGVLPCSGHHVDPYIPEFKGLCDQFQGQVIHSHSYKDHRGFEDKRIVVIGMGNSGGDIAVELSNVAKQVFLVTRRGGWIFNRLGKQGYPLDCKKNRLIAWVLLNHTWLANTIGEHDLNQRFDHANYGLKPAHRLFYSQPTLNDELPNKILCGTIIIKPDVKEFTEDGVEFEDGTTENHIDMVILATGFSFDFPFLEQGTLIPVNENKVSLYKRMYIPHLAHPETLGVIGLFQVAGSLPPVSEMQCRVFCDVLCGRSTLPNQAKMEMEIEQKHLEQARNLPSSRRNYLTINREQYMDELAAIIGAEPYHNSLWFSDPALAKALLFGPPVTYQFRLNGPHPWPGAREAILTAWSRILAPTRRTKFYNEDNKKSMLNYVFPISIAVVLVILWFFKFS